MTDDLDLQGELFADVADLGRRVRNLEADFEAAHGAQDVRELGTTEGAGGSAPPVLESGSGRDGPLLLPAATVEWGTPPKLVRYYAQRWAGGGFDLDVAASRWLHVCPTYYTVEDDGLSLPWRGRVWCNPPYGRVEELWVAKAVREVLAGRAELVVMFLPAKTGKVWFQRYVMGPRGGAPRGELRLRYPCADVDFVKGRVRYVKPDGTPGDVAGFASVALLFEAWTLGAPARRRSSSRGADRQLALFGAGRPLRD